MSHAANNTTPNGKMALPPENRCSTICSMSPAGNSDKIVQAVSVSHLAFFSAKLMITAQLAEGAIMP
jgi:hypothetical protein